MTHATTTHTNTPRRAHPAAVRAALRSRRRNTTATYTYDPVANRITDSKTAAATWVYNENNQLTQADNLSYTYDDNGNTTNQTDSANAANTRNYIYDTDNRLIEVRNNSNTLIAAYSYDPFGRRLSKDVGSSKTYYFYNAEGLIAEADASGQVTKSYGYAPGSTFTTNPLWMKATATGSSTQNYYTYQNDHLGTPMKLLNQSGVVVWSATYDAFGRATVDAGSTVTNNLRYPGQYEDAEMGLHYNWRRYYDPNTGRYPTSDPIGLEGGINEYTYVYANPVNLTDPTGEFVPIAAIAVCMASCALTTAAINAATGECNNWGNTAKDCAISCVAGMGLGWIGLASGPRGVLFGRGRYRDGVSGLFNQGNRRFGWSWNKNGWAGSRNYFGPHGGTPGKPDHWHWQPIPGPKGPGW